MLTFKLSVSSDLLTVCHQLPWCDQIILRHEAHVCMPAIKSVSGISLQTIFPNGVTEINDQHELLKLETKPDFQLSYAGIKSTMSRGHLNGQL
jgi:hypothetical protein